MKTEDYSYLHALENDFWWFVGMREITAALLDPYCLSLQRSLRVLDAGCGTGGNLQWLDRYAREGNKFGIDLMNDAIQYCRIGKHRNLARASTTALPFKNSVFDLVTSFDVLGQLPSPRDVDEALTQFFRVLKPGGLLFVRIAAYDWLRSDHDDVLETRRRYDIPTLLGVTTQAGFKTLRATYANGLLLPAAILNRLVLKRIGIAGKGSDVKPLPTKLRWLNRPLVELLTREAAWLARSNARIPAGLSVICICQKPLN